MDYQNIKIYHFSHDTFRLETDHKVVYLDPYNLKESQAKLADYVLITHGHFDHLSPNDIKKIITEDTIIIASTECQEQLKGLKVKEIIYVAPAQQMELDGLKVETVPAYNLNKWRLVGVPYHPKEDGKVGYVLEFSGTRIYFAGDTDNIPELSQLENIDLALLPVSGTYVMTWQEAVEAIKVIKPKLVIPMHYGSVVGTRSDAENFKQAVLADLERTSCQVEII